MSKFINLAVAILILITHQACAQHATHQAIDNKRHTTPEEAINDAAKYNFKGWDYLVKRLLAEGVPLAELVKIYTNPALPAFEPVTFSVNPKESKDIYRGFIAPRNVLRGQNFIAENIEIFNAVQEKYQVPAQVITAILLVESGFGHNTGKEVIIYRLSRLANINNPKNLKENYLRLKKDDPKLTWSQVAKRGQYLEDTFLPEVIATLDVCHENQISPFNFLGSSAGAFGWAQFLPSSYLKYAVDYNEDGRRSLYTKEDAIASIANYLHSHGWGKVADREVIWKYNKSDAYIDTILGLAERF